MPEVTLFTCAVSPAWDGSRDDKFDALEETVALAAVSPAVATLAPTDDHLAKVRAQAYEDAMHGFDEDSLPATTWSALADGHGLAEGQVHTLHDDETRELLAVVVVQKVQLT